MQSLFCSDKTKCDAWVCIYCLLMVPLIMLQIHITWYEYMALDHPPTCGDTLSAFDCALYLSVRYTVNQLVRGLFPARWNNCMVIKIKMWGTCIHGFTVHVCSVSESVPAGNIFWIKQHKWLRKDITPCIWARIWHWDVHSSVWIMSVKGNST